MNRSTEKAMADDTRIFYGIITSSPDQPGPEIERPCTVQRELLPVPFLLCLRIKPWGEISGIIIERERVGDKKAFPGFFFLVLPASNLIFAFLSAVHIHNQ